MNRSTPGLPVHHQLPEFTQTHIYWVGDVIQPSDPLLSPSPPAPNPSQHWMTELNWTELKVKRTSLLGVSCRSLSLVMFKCEKYSTYFSCLSSCLRICPLSSSVISSLKKLHFSQFEILYVKFYFKAPFLDSDRAPRQLQSSTDQRQPCVWTHPPPFFQLPIST